MKIEETLIVGRTRFKKKSVAVVTLKNIVNMNYKKKKTPLKIQASFFFFGFVIEL